MLKKGAQKGVAPRILSQHNVVFGEDPMHLQKYYLNMVIFH
jgi:hypothetical protein